MKSLACLSLLALALAPAIATAQCPPMSAYRVAGVSADRLPITDAMDIIFAGTAWKPHFTGPASDVRVTFRGVSGPLDLVFEKVIAGAGRASTAAVSAVSDPALCVTTISVKAPPAPVKPAPAVLVAADAAGVAVPRAVPTNVVPERARPSYKPEILPAGSNLSAALRGYVEKRGWHLRWLIDEDYVLDAPLPIPPMDMIDGVTWVVRAYQAQGGMQGVVPRFAKGNNIVVIESMDVREAVR